MLSYAKNSLFKTIRPFCKLGMRSFSSTVQTAKELPGDMSEVNHFIVADYSGPLLQTKEAYGPLFRAMTVFGPTIIVSELDDIKFVVGQEESGNIDAIGFSPAQWDFVGIKESVFDNFPQYRKALNRAMSKTNLTQLLRDIQNMTMEHMDYMTKNPAEVFFDNLVHYTVSVSTLINFGPGLYTIDETRDFVQPVENYSMFMLMQSTDDMFGQMAVPAKEYLDKIAIKNLKPYLWDPETKENYDEAIKNRDKLEQDLEEGRQPFAVSSAMAVARDDDGNYLFNDRQLYGIGADTFGAATDTTASALTFACYSLATNPRCRQLLLEELSNFEHVDSDGYVTDLFKFLELPYLDAFINESMRIYGSHGFVRSMKNDVVYKDYLLPKGYAVFVRPVDRRMNPDKYWPIGENYSEEEIAQFSEGSNTFPDIADGNAFLPERWLTKEGKLKRLSVDHKSMFLPFGVGTHICAGRYLAELEMKLVIRQLVMNYQVNINQDNIDYFVALVPKLRYKATVERRS